MDVWNLMINSYFVSVTFGVLIPYLLYKLLTKNHNYWKDRNIPFVKPYPLVGSFLEAFSKSFEDLDLERHLKLGRIYGVYESTQPSIIVAEPELLRDILLKDFQSFQNRRPLDMGNPVLNKMMSVVEGEDWKRIRSIVSPTFSTGKLKRVLSIFQDCAKTTIQNFMKASNNGEPIDVLRAYGGLTMDIIASSAFSTKLDSHNDPDNIFIKKAKVIFNQGFNFRFILFILAPKLMKKLKIPLFPLDSTEFFQNTALEIIKARRESKQTRNDFLQLLLDSADELSKEASIEDNSEDIAANYKDESSNHSVFRNLSSKQISMDELIAQCVIFFLAGYHTTATTLAIVTYVLAVNQEEQEKVFQEITNVLQETNGELKYEALQKMKYLDNVISETFRIYPPGTRIERRAEEDYKLGNTGITIPKGMIVGIPIYAMHRDPAFFPEPDKFNPDRFKPEERDKIIPYTYVPFGAGPRNCVGMRFALLEVKVVLVYVFSTFKVEKGPTTKVPLELEKAQGILRPKPVILRLLKRDNCPLKL